SYRSWDYKFNTFFDGGLWLTKIHHLNMHQAARTLLSIPVTNLVAFLFTAKPLDLFYHSQDCEIETFIGGGLRLTLLVD
ncbi:hypothetical protein ACFL27_18700, partial [candidate division CSSED10-310 bacterium]